MLKRRDVLLLLAPAHGLVLALVAAPAVALLWLSLHTSSFGLGATWAGLANYAAVLADPRFWGAMRNTAVVVLVVVHAELLLGLLLALLFASGLPMRRVLLAAALAPYAVSEVAAVVVWRWLLDPEVGPLAAALRLVGLPTLEWAVSPSAGLAVVALLGVWLNLPFTFVLLYAARLSVPGELYEAARVDGATPWQAFRRVTLPAMLPAILVAALFRMVFAFRLFGEVWLLTGGGPARQTEVVAVYLYLEAFRYNAFGPAAATGFLMVAASLLLAAPYLLRLARARGAEG